MILIDFKQLANLTFFSGMKNGNNYELDPFRHQFINYLLFLRSKFKVEYGELIICLDSKRYWRKDIFKYYKAGRKEAREKSDIDFKKVYENFGALTEDLRNYLPYKVIEVDGAEADDIIGTFAARFHNQEKIMIVSSDKDFLQLQQYNGVSQYSPMTKAEIKDQHPELALREKIIRGDSGDGIPNCKTRDDIFVTEGKSVSITKKWLETVLKVPDIESVLDEVELYGYNRNKKLIDLSFTPKEIKEQIIEKYSTVIPANKSGVVNYLTERGYSNLMEQLYAF